MAQTLKYNNFNILQDEEKDAIIRVYLALADYRQNQLKEASHTYLQKNGEVRINYTIDYVASHFGLIEQNIDNIKNIDISQLIKDAYINYLEFFN